MTTNLVRNATIEALEDVQAADALEFTSFMQDLADNLRQRGEMVETFLTMNRSGDALDQRDSEYLVEYMTSRDLGTICWSSRKRVEETEEGITRLANQLGAMVRRSRGSSVDDERISDQSERIHDRERQLTCALAMSEAAQLVYLDMTGKHYGPADPSNPSVETAATQVASALIAKYGNTEANAAPTGDKRPQTWIDESGTTHILGADGKYHATAA